VDEVCAHGAREKARERPRVSLHPNLVDDVALGQDRGVIADESRVGRVAIKIKDPLQGASPSRSRRITRAGLPATIVRAGTSFVTTAPAPIIAPSPIVTPGRITAPLPIEARRLTTVGRTFQSASVCIDPSG